MNKEMEKVEARRVYADTHNQVDAAKGERVISTNPKTGRPFIVDQMHQTRKDFKENDQSAMIVAENTVAIIKNVSGAKIPGSQIISAINNAEKIEKKIEEKIKQKAKDIKADLNK
ncbi:hypothetical protein [Undibacterium sp.]|uniref:hypothetical protein n=1 Tax=Undibacterium sp. TaxID=1914977 RepID=UPI003752E8FC